MRRRARAGADARRAVRLPLDERHHHVVGVGVAQEGVREQARGHLAAGLARDEKGRAVDVHKFKAAVLGNTKRRSLAEAEPVRARTKIEMAR